MMHLQPPRRPSARPAPSSRHVRSMRGLPYAVLVLLLAALLSANVVAQTTVRVAFLGEPDTDSHRGAQQGLSEANAQGRFLGLRYELVTVGDAAEASGISAAAIVASVSPLRLLRAAAAAPGTAVFNVSAPDDELREECLPNLFHTIPSNAMHDDALQQWHRKEPRSRADSRAWHASHRKYAAAQLNRRYREAFARAMTDEAWAGWAAVKVLSDTVARLQGADPLAVVEALQTDLAFDGQKGIDMSFRDTGQLRQPLLLVEDDAIVGEAPVRGIVNTTNLDSLGLPSCRK